MEEGGYHSKLPLYTLWHQLTHFLELDSPLSCGRNLSAHIRIVQRDRML